MQLNTKPDSFLYLKWLDSYNIGNAIIDEQHRGIISLINSLFYAIENRFSKAVLAPIWNMMDDYAMIHFATEERILERAEYPRIEEHKKIHGGLMTRMQTVRNESIHEQDPDIALIFLRTWWTNHICEEDRKYSKWVNSVI